MSYESELTAEAQSTVLNAVREGVFNNEELISLVEKLISAESVYGIEYSLEKMGLDLADLDHRVREQQVEDCAWYEYKDFMNKGVV